MYDGEESTPKYQSFIDNLVSSLQFNGILNVNPKEQLLDFLS